MADCCCELMRSVSWSDKSKGLKCYRSHQTPASNSTSTFSLPPSATSRTPATLDSSLRLTGNLTSSLPSPSEAARPSKRIKLSSNVAAIPKTATILQTPSQANDIDADDPNPRSKLSCDDFRTDSISPDRVREIIRLHPKLLQRNFYVLQRHWATSRHYDLRLHLDGATTSFCIPRGLSGLDKEPNGTQRLAIDTNPHPVSYSLFEGGGKHVTGVWDIGSYVIRETRAATERGADTDEEDESNSFTPDEHQENRFAEKYHNARFIDLPSRYGESVVRTNPDRGHKRAFVVELQGARFQGLRLRFMRGSDDFSLTASGKQENYTIAIDKNGPPAVENMTLGDRSILSQKTMEQIKVDMSSVIWNASGATGEGASGC